MPATKLDVNIEKTDRGGFAVAVTGLDGPGAMEIVADAPALENLLRSYGATSAQIRSASRDLEASGQARLELAQA
jgi:hypothetical protein